MASQHVQEETATSVLSDAPTLAGSPQTSTFVGNGNTKIIGEDVPKIIPTEHQGRNLVLCFDGTGDQFDSDNSNIVELFSMLKKDDRTKQMVYYQAGIGTYTSPQIATPLGAKISKTLDMMVAWNLSAHVMDGYEFLMQNYQAGDKICIFGFSRGAYTARSLAGMLHKVGLLPACNWQQVPFAYKMYTRADEIGWAQSNAFKKAFSIDVSIEFIGVWDTVNSVGIIPRTLPFVTSNTIVRTFRHAVSLDERRSKFKANLWNRPTEHESKLGIGIKPMTTGPPAAGGNGKTPEHAGSSQRQPKKNAARALEKKYSGTSVIPTDIKEVWFAGCHCDVGGGSVENGTPNSLARIPLRWMIRECFATNSGILFDSQSLWTAGLDPSSVWPVVKPRPSPLPLGSSFLQHIPPPSKDPIKPHFADVDDLIPTPRKTEEEHELLDALSPIYDQLSLAKGWWILELLPVKQRYQLSNNDWETVRWPNLGTGRFIPRQKRQKINVHRSVKLRMDAQYANGQKYEPRASFQTALSLGNVEWVD